MNSIRHGRELGQPRVRRHRLSIADGNTPPPPLSPPSIGAPPALVISSDGNNLLYTAGVWLGNPTPTVTRTLNVIGVGTFPAEAVMPIQPAWRGRTVNVSESAINSQGGPMITGTGNLAIPAASLDQQVEAILAGTNSFALDPQDLATVWQNNTGTLPVTSNGQTVGRIVGKFGLGSAVIFTQDTAAARPSYLDGAIQFDGVDDLLIGNGAADVSRNAPAMFNCHSVIMEDDATAHGLLSYATVNATQSRYVTSVDASRRLVFAIRRPDGTGFAQTYPAPLLTYGVPTVITMQADGAGTAQTRAWVDGVAGTPQTFGTPASFSDTASVMVRLGHGLGGGNQMKGRIGRTVVCSFIPTDEQRAILEAWVAA